MKQRNLRHFWGQSLMMRLNRPWGLSPEVRYLEEFER